MNKKGASPSAEDTSSKTDAYDFREHTVYTKSVAFFFLQV